jgi:hypothetical protein
MSLTMQTQFFYRGHSVNLRQIRTNPYDRFFAIWIDGTEQNLMDDPTEPPGLPLNDAIKAAKKVIDWLENTKDEALEKDVKKDVKKDEDSEQLPF